jgi:hypothetical protein
VGCTSTKDEAPSLDAYARSELGLSAFKSARTDLDSDGDNEIILYARDQSFCGSGGCTLFIVAREGSAFRLVGRTTITKLPIRLLDTSTKGWRDLSVVIQGGGIVEAQDVKLAFDGLSYPRNPTVPPAEPITKASGTILIGP